MSRHRIPAPDAVRLINAYSSLVRSVLWPGGPSIEAVRALLAIVPDDLLIGLAEFEDAEEAKQLKRWPYRKNGKATIARWVAREARRALDHPGR